MLFLHNSHIYLCKWIVHIEMILQDAGLNYIWHNNNVHNTDWLCHEVRKKLQCKDLQKNGIFFEIQSSSKSVNY